MTEPGARYDYERNKWVPQCPYGDVCTGCDAAGRCTRVCEHVNVTRAAPLYVDGRPLYKCDDCDARLVPENVEPTACGLAPLRMEPTR